MTEQDVRECAHRRCEQSADQRVRFPGGEQRAYCDGHASDLSHHNVEYRVVSVA